MCWCGLIWVYNSACPASTHLSSKASVYYSPRRPSDVAAWERCVAGWAAARCPSTRRRGLHLRYILLSTCCEAAECRHLDTINTLATEPCQSHSNGVVTSNTASNMFGCTCISIAAQDYAVDVPRVRLLWMVSLVMVAMPLSWRCTMVGGCGFFHFSSHGGPPVV